MGHLLDPHVYRCQGAFVLALGISEGAHRRVRKGISGGLGIKILQAHKIGETQGCRGLVIGFHNTVVGTLHGLT